MRERPVDLKPTVKNAQIKFGVPNENFASASLEAECSEFEVVSWPNQSARSTGGPQYRSTPNEKFWDPKLGCLSSIDQFSRFRAFS